MKVITVSYERGDEYDVERCAQALRKRFPKAVFTVERSGAREHDIRVRNGEAVEYELMRPFAEGFMASAHLWER